MKQLLDDPRQQPSETLLQTVLGDNYANYKRMERIFAERGLTCTWNYYRDGKRWLGKVCGPKRSTVLWLSVWEGCFKLSFFFTEKTGAGVEELGIDPEIKAKFRAQKPAGKLIPLVLEICAKTPLGDAEKVVDYKIYGKKL